MDQDGVAFRSHFGQAGNGRRIEQLRHLRFVLGPVHGRVGGAVHDHIHLFRITDDPDGVDVRNVQMDDLLAGRRSDVGEDETVRTGRSQLADLGPKLSAGSGNENIHNQQI